MRVSVSIKLKNIAHNIKQLQAKLKENTAIMAVVKADAYGHGSHEITKYLAKEKLVSGLAVATYDEAKELLDVRGNLPILILGHSFFDDFEEIINHDIRTTIYRLDTVLQLSKVAQRLEKTAHIHIKVDTGMGRIGISPNEEGVSFVQQVSQLPFIEIEGMFTHFATADEEKKEKTYSQYHKFSAFVKKIEDIGIKIPCKHCANSAATMELQEMQLDMVRVGIAMYGMVPSEEMKQDVFDLKPALSWHSQVVYVKNVSANTEISYGAMFVAQDEMKVATIPIGYADGYPRSLSNKGSVLIRGQHCPILGRVCMDQFMVDVTHLETVMEEDVVTLIGCDGDNTLTATEIGELSGRFHYELVCVISKRVPRIYDYDS